eukprot:scaffold113933_cov25-Cyclotella_meneghiniana.AAC.1
MQLATEQRKKAKTQQPLKHKPNFLLCSLPLHKRGEQKKISTRRARLPWQIMEWGCGSYGVCRQ